MSIVDRVVKTLDDLKVAEIKVYNLTQLSPIADHYIVGTAESMVQLEAARSNVEEEMWKDRLLLKNPMEDWSGGWLIMDFGNVIVNVFLEEMRTFYNLDDLLGAGKLNLDEIKDAVKR